LCAARAPPLRDHRILEFFGARGTVMTVTPRPFVALEREQRAAAVGRAARR
jgi:hypothetical protein